MIVEVGLSLDELVFSGHANRRRRERAVHDDEITALLAECYHVLKGDGTRSLVALDRSLTLVLGADARTVITLIRPGIPPARRRRTRSPRRSRTRPSNRERFCP